MDWKEIDFSIYIYMASPFFDIKLFTSQYSKLNNHAFFYEVYIVGHQFENIVPEHNFHVFIVV
jgi:hypothetical protein